MGWITLGRTVFEFSKQKVLVLYSEKCNLQKLIIRISFWSHNSFKNFGFDRKTVFEILVKIIRFYKLPKIFWRIQILNQGLMALILVISKQSTASAGIEKENEHDIKVWDFFISSKKKVCPFCPIARISLQNKFKSKLITHQLSNKP